MLKALALVFGLTGALAIVQLLFPATAGYMQAALAIILMQTPPWVLKGSGITELHLGITLRPWARSAAWGIGTMAVIFPLFVGGYHLVQTELFGRTAAWEVDRLARWDEALERTPAHPCGRPGRITHAWTSGDGLWIVGAVDQSLKVKIRGDRVPKARSITCSPARGPRAITTLSADQANTFSPKPGRGLWLDVSTERSVSIEIRDAQGLIPRDALRTGQYASAADAPGVIEADKGMLWLLVYLLIHLGLVALPEEWFFRGYLMGRMDGAMGTPIRFLGANLGWGLILSALAFALLHPILLPGAHRLLVFFPALLFGWLRARTGNIGAAVLVHAGSNVLIAIVSRMYLAM